MFSFWKRFHPLLKFPVILFGAFIFTKRLRNPPILVFEAYVWVLRLMLCFRPRQWVRFAARQPAARCRWRYFKRLTDLHLLITFLLSVYSNWLWIFIISHITVLHIVRDILTLFYTPCCWIAMHYWLWKVVQSKILSLNHVRKIEWSPLSIFRWFCQLTSQSQRHHAMVW